MENGQSVRRGTFIDIPLVYDSPHFAKDDSAQEEDDLHGHFVLRLESFICHQGNRTDFGHYISCVRTPGENGDPDRWLLMDDLAKDRVSYVNDIRELLNKEQPYLLFYGVEPISPDPPPAYRESVGQDSAVAGVSEFSGRQNPDPSLLNNQKGTPNDCRRQSWALSEPAVDESRDSAASYPSPDSNQSATNTSRRGSKISQIPTSLSTSGEPTQKRPSLSLSRLSGRLSKERSNPNLAVSGSNSRSSIAASRLSTSDGSQTPETTPLHTEKPSHSHGHRMLSKQKLENSEKPQCLLM